MRSVLVGAVESTAVVFRALVREGVPPQCVVTLPASSAARHSDFVDLAPLAAAAEVPVLATTRANDPDLPRDRGRAVIPWTILQGRTATASTLFWIDEGMDSGDILAQEPVAVAADETAATLYAKHMAALDRMVSRLVPALRDGTAPRRPQDHSRATWCARRTAADGLIDWSRPAREVWALVRAAGAPYPGAFTFAGGARVTILEADYAGPAPYVGLDGQVQALLPAGALVRCGDGEHLLVKTVRQGDGAPAAAAAVLKNHSRLGLDLLALHALLTEGDRS
jgi:methionyl-tRNA formyltransferase